MGEYDSGATRAWHGDPMLKAEVLDRIGRLHADGLITRASRGYQEPCPDTLSGYRCTLAGALLPQQPSSPGRGYIRWFDEVEERTGIIAEVGQLLETAFSLHPDQPADFAVTSLACIAVGASLDLVPDRLMLDLLTDQVHGAVVTHPVPAVHDVAALFRRRVAGDEPSGEEWSSALRAVGAVGVPPLVSDAAWIGTRNYYTSDTYSHAAESAAVSDEHKRWLATRLVHHLARATRRT